MRDSNVLPLTPNQIFSTCLNQFKKLVICRKVTGFSNIGLISAYIPEESHYNIHSNENLISHVQISTPGYCFREMSLSHIIVQHLIFTIYASVPCSSQFTTTFITHFYLPSMPVFHVPHVSLHSYHLPVCQRSSLS
jgi:hypothetical protein